MLTRGGFLFRTARHEDGMSLSPGAVDGPRGLRLRKYIFTRFKGDYDDIADGVPQRED